MKSNSISVVVMTKSRRDTLRINNLLSSLEGQTLLPAEVILVDTSESVSNMTEQLCEYHSTKYWHKPQKEFNKSKALNFGIKKAKGEYIMCADVDMMFEPRFIEKVMEKLLFREKSFVLAQCGYLYEIPSDKYNWRWSDLVNEIDPDRHSKKHSPGAIQATKAEWFRKVRGYDEGFVGLGGMDNDMIDRAISDGLEVVWIEFEEAQCYHQPHKISDMKGQSAGRFMQDRDIVKNLKSWGELQ
jgi:glycosyltransferase involved in cell wall biosynthesis